MRHRTLLLALSLAARAAAAPTSIIDDIPDVDEGEADEDGPWMGGGGMQYGDDGAQMLYAYEDDEIMMDGEYQGGGYGAAGYYGEEEIEQQLTELFGRFDTNGDAFLDQSELRAALMAQATRYARLAAESSEAETEELLAQADEDEDGKLSEAEFEKMETLYLQHERSIGRQALFRFADSGEGPAGGGDGKVEMTELHLLIFPESHPRGPELRKFLTSHVVRQHDADSDARIDAAELYAFHKRGSEARHRHDGGVAAEARRSGWLEHRRPGRQADDDAGGGDADGDDDDTGYGDEEEIDYASHNETFAWHDKDGDGTLDEDELSEYLLPRREDSEEGYVDEELRQLMSVLHRSRGADRIDYEEEEEEEEEEEAPPPGGGAEARFDVTRLREVGSMVLGAFPMLRDLAEETHGGEL